jgi:hypothetical protein
MNGHDEWSPDEPLGTEAFEQGDEALDERARIDPEIVEDVLSDPTLDPSLVVDERELEEAGAELDDPEALVTLEGMIDDPDGRGGPTGKELARQRDHEGWDLDEPLVRELEQEEEGPRPQTAPA